MSQLLWIISGGTICILLGYLIGSANTSLIIGRFYGTDVRRCGSGNAGMTNTLRTLGKLPALLVIIGDLLKGVLACAAGYFVIMNIFNLQNLHEQRAFIGQLGVLSGGIGAILGHNWPLYFGFRGGKGVLTTFAVILFVAPMYGLILLALFLLIVALTRYISLGSVVASLAFPFLVVLKGNSAEFIVFAFFVAFLVIVRHRTNIVRLIRGNESKLGDKKAKL
ncbi:MAG: glycerol-3-phosphate 1-O-acyltransferase PlsY [Clostridium sp.]|nr:glycerol-3-phosphate 1-O-acyltransferase PlsY [Clostridium sp.]